jgi:mxaJ protein
MRNLISFAALALAFALCAGARAQGTLGVCANPNNLPFSNAKGEGFENTLAELIARDLAKRVRYTWTAEHEHFVKKTLDAGKCDVLMGVPAGFDEVDTTRPYYISGYVFVSRRDLNISSMRDPRLHKLKIGVHVIGDDNTPPMEAFARQGITQNVVGYMIFRDQVRNHSRLVDDVAAGKVDVAAVWGPLGGYYVSRAARPLRVSLITDTGSFAPAMFQYAIAMGVRKGNTALRDRLNAILVRERPVIRNLLARYGVPIVEMPVGVAG